MRQTANVLTALLAILAAVIAARVAMGLNAWPFVATYWVVNTVRNALDALGRMKG